MLHFELGSGLSWAVLPVITVVTPLRPGRAWAVHEAPMRCLASGKLSSGGPWSSSMWPSRGVGQKSPCGCGLQEGSLDAQVLSKPLLASRTMC